MKNKLIFFRLSKGLAQVVMILPEEIAKKESKSVEEELKVLKICLLLKRINAITGIFIPLNTS